MKKTILIVMLLPFVQQAYSQQNASYSQYIMNKQQLNPAYVGYREAANVTLTHRSQWIGFEGAPVTQALALEGPISKSDMAYGVSIVHDKIGPISSLSFGGDLDYRLRIKRRQTISFGLKASGTIYQSRLNDVLLTSDYFGEVDEDFIETSESIFVPNAGFGVYYYTDNSYISLSSPKMLRMKLANKGSLSYDLLEGRTEPTYYFMTGKMFKINRELKFQPNFISQLTLNSPLSLGMHLNLIYNKALTTGIFYHYEEAAGGLIQWQFDKQWKVGYSIEVAASKLIQTNFGSHELFINYKLKQKRNRVVYPRYF